MKNLTKAQAIKTIIDCAMQYKDNLVNRMLLFLVTDKNKKISHFEVSFDSANFLHLTGCKIDDHKISALKFYEKCIHKKLSENDFEFSDDGTTPLKLAVLSMMLCKSLSANSIGSYNQKRPALYTERLAGNIKGCMGFVEDKKSKRYVPNTVLKVDIRDYVLKTDRILVTYRKYKNDKSYSEIVYAAKRVEWDKIKFPDEYRHLPKPK